MNKPCNLYRTTKPWITIENLEIEILFDHRNSTSSISKIYLTPQHRTNVSHLQKFAKHSHVAYVRLSTTNYCSTSIRLCISKRSLSIANECYRMLSDRSDEDILIASLGNFFLNAFPITRFSKFRSDKSGHETQHFYLLVDKIKYIIDSQHRNIFKEGLFL